MHQIPTRSGVGRAPVCAGPFVMSRPVRSMACVRIFNAFAALLLLVAAAAWQPALAAQKSLLVLGDSLTAGYGLPLEESFPAQLEAALRKKGHDIKVVNGGVSGDTTAGGLARLDWLLAAKPDFAIVALGANDGLRGLDPARSRESLDAIVVRLKRDGVRVLIAGMLAPPNLGKAYGTEFNAIFPALARTHEVPLYPFFLEDVAAHPELNQQDGIHPNAKGVAVMVVRMMPMIEQLLAGS